MNQQRRLSRHNSKQSSICETASVGSTKSGKSNGSSDYGQRTSSQGSSNNNKKLSNGIGKQGSQDSSQDGSVQGVANSPSTNILNVAEMLLHGVADGEILEIWLKSIQCEEFVAKFIDAGYDMPTLSRITPQDLTAIGVTEPTKRLKILSEIRKLNLQDGIPNFRPASLDHCLSLIRLDSYYYKALCDQKVDTLEKLCQLTWEDFEELGITKLGHQKRIQLAIERIKELDANEKCASKPLQEPIYDTNISQILLAASNTENHSSNAPIINKQSSTSELSSTGSGSMLSVYSATSANYHQGLSPQPLNNQQQQQPMIVGQLPNGGHCLQQQQQPIYSQPPPQMIYQQPSQVTNANQLLHQAPPPPLPTTATQQQLHYQPIYQQVPLVPNQTNPNQFMNGPVISDSLNGFRNGLNPLQNRQSMSQLPFSALANLPKHQQQLLQQSSIYATLSRQPAKAKQPPPPVPIRTNSLKSNSLTDEANNKQQSISNGGHNSSTSSLYRSGTIVNRGQYNSQTMLTKNKSFSGNAHMEASRARFLQKSLQEQQQQQQQLQQQQQQQRQCWSVINSNGDNPTSQSSSSHDSGSSQTLYNSASSGSQDQSLNQVFHQASGGISTASSCTLNDLGFTPDPQQKPTPLPSFGVPSKLPSQPVQFNATTGKDDDFPPPPSPLSLTDSDEHDLVSINSDSNFTDISNGLMGFRVGIM